MTMLYHIMYSKHVITGITWLVVKA